MESIKFKRTTHGAFNSYFTGLNRMRYEIEEKKLQYGSKLIPHEYYVKTVYNPRKDCTYFAMSCEGYLMMFRPSDKDFLLVARLEGKVKCEDVSDEVLQIMCEETLKEFNEHMDSLKSKENEED